MDAMNLLVSFLLLMVTATSMTAAQATPKPPGELKITTITEKPFLMITSAGTFEGYIVDLVNALADEVGFKYKLKLVADGRYGALTPDGKWNGMIGELLNKTVDMSAAALTISYIRSQVVDFSKPYLKLGTTILMRKPTRERQSSMFAILAPFEVEVWVFIVIAYAVMSFILFLLGRFTEWQQNPNSDHSDIEERNAFSCLNSAWFLFGFPGKAGLTPISLSVRIVSAVWWIFSFFVFATYVASLSSIIGVVSNSMPKPTVESASDLAAQTKIKYGTIAGGSTMTFFKTSKISVYEKMWQFMSTHEPSVFVRTSKEGFERARRGNYAFIAESTTIDYIVQRECSLMKVGGLLDSKGYGLAFPKGSPYKDSVNLALLKLQESGRLHQLYRKWFHSNSCVQDDDDKLPRHVNIGVSEIRGAFVILVLGVIVAVVVAIFECLYRAAQRSKDKKSTFSDQFSSDQKRSVGGCCSTTRDVTPPPRSASPSELKQGA
ncbi:glutamate receptor ionotropic, kainate 2-like [Tubulanus polymorphus]|uniref:glutamate receptor ionotropic, kainate 2-like n=1 Tax=Tubulanus polymorphus TaxID=672921 RepID=UPI003DA1D037